MNEVPMVTTRVLLASVLLFSCPFGQAKEPADERAAHDVPELPMAIPRKPLESLLLRSHRRRKVATEIFAT
jgi:hypothetical protein